MKNLFLFCSLFTAPAAFAQFAPQVGITGSDAIHMSSPSIKAWASKCTVTRGFADIADHSLGYTSAGDASFATGIADGDIVSLGDSGIALLQFEAPVYNGPGPDFAIFENGFANPANKEEAFLELAFVEVSADGEHFYRFPAESHTPLEAQVKGSGDYMNARLIRNLAGKYISKNGTPFDLEDLKDIKGLDINNITHIRLVDVIGDISGGHSSRDKDNNIINDPYPTAFATGGFDLDAVAAIHIKSSAISPVILSDVSIYPNPAAEYIHIDAGAYTYQAVLRDMTGRTVAQTAASGYSVISIAALIPGLYYLSITNTEGAQWTGKISKQ